MGVINALPAAVIDRRAGGTATELHDAFVALTPSAIAQMLVDFGKDIRKGRLPAGSPYRHVNGFTKFIIAKYPTGARLTLHYWPAAKTAMEDVSRPHDHRFPFSSILLGGQQQFVELEEVPDDDGAQPWRRFRYMPYLSGRFATVRLNGLTRLRPTRTVRRSPLKGHYTTSSTVIHQAVTERDTACATLVLRLPREHRIANVYYELGETAPTGGVQLGRRLNRNQLLSQLDDTLAMIGL